MKIDMEFACRDDCLDRMVPSDLRQVIAERDAALAELAALKGGQEAVAWRMWNGKTWRFCYSDLHGKRGWEALYTAPPAQASAWPEATEAMVMAARGVCVSFRGHYGEYNEFLDDWTARQIIEAALSAHKTGEEE